MQPGKFITDGRIVCSRCRTELTPEYHAVRATNSNDEDQQFICAFCGGDLFDRVCEEHDTPEAFH